MILNAKAKNKETKKASAEQFLNIQDNREALLILPNEYNFNKALPLLVLLHGSGGSVNSWKKVDNVLKSYNIAVLLIKSKERTWDIIINRNENGFGEFEEDAKFINNALEYMFNNYSIDKNKIALGGFSDGASYALSLGLLKGELFTHIIAYSPGFIKSSDNFRGKPKIYIIHGQKDKMLSIELRS